MSNDPDITAFFELLKIFYRKVDEEISRLSEIHAGLKCRLGCSDCCVDKISVFHIEARNITHHFETMLRTARPHELGKCAFLGNQEDCRIYEHRPYVCRTQGLPLRWIDDNDKGERIEWRDICPKNNEIIVLMNLPENACFTLGHFEGLLAELQKNAFGNLRRDQLRSLFGEI